MVTTILYGSPVATLELLLDDPDEHDFASMCRLLDGLSIEQAVTLPTGLPYSIASLLAHMNSNVRYNLELIQSADPATFNNPYDNWPAVEADLWPNLVAEFLAGMDALKRLAWDEELSRTLFTANGGAPAWTVGYKLAASVAKHNAYHFGQIALLRRFIGAWS